MTWICMLIWLIGYFIDQISQYAPYNVFFHDYMNKLDILSWYFPNQITIPERTI